MKRVLLISISVILLLILAVASIGLRLDAEKARQALVRQVEVTSGLRLEIGEARIAPLRGLMLHDVTVSGRLEAGELTARAERILLSSRLLPLLGGQLVLRQIAVHRPVVELTSRSPRGRQDEGGTRLSREERRAKRRQKQAVEKGDEERSTAVPAQTSVSNLRLSIESLSLRDGVFSARTVGSDEVDLHVEEIDLNLRQLQFDRDSVAVIGALEGSGSVATGAIQHGLVEAAGLRSELQLGDGRLVLQDLELDFENGIVRSEEVYIAMGKNPPRYRMDAAGTLDLDGMLGFDGDGGFGELAFDMALTADGPDLAMLSGRGEAVLGRGSIPPIPAVVAAEEIAGQALLTGREYEGAELTFRIVDERVELDPFAIVGKGASVEAAGEVTLGGTLDLGLEVHLEPQSMGVDGALGEILQSLVGEDTRLSFPLAVVGTLEEPRVGLDSDRRRDRSR